MEGGVLEWVKESSWEASIVFQVREGVTMVLGGRNRDK